MNKRILLIDGMALLFRHFFATSVHKNYMINSNGIPTNGTQGFVRHVLRAVTDIQPTHLAVCWDMGKTTFRNELFQGYKQNRPEPPEALVPQFSHVQQISQALGFFNIGLPNYEADDVIGTLATQSAHDTHTNVYVITGDRDLLQCSAENIHIWLVKKGFTEYLKFDDATFREHYGLAPKQLIDVKAFMGDTADGYPGVKGIGEKTAIKLIQQYGSVEEVISNITALTPGQQKKINANMDNLLCSKRLAEIICDAPIETQDIWQQMTYRPDLEHILNVCDEHELRVAKRYILSL
ncbi:5'-3' exonuclease [Staphylococcus americanisciuri]|uniref:5'-3' exonuclease n=1 Tax=Staphylococcus americanisciuri TaxID=2973940 RepID=A0ABT2EYX3_9STAP|nr:5'-3' exonuclease [Staphylococcus americanisciuri]MCS4485434.1 5'-3' exonuclease [Staphylococcus americanisciuri]